MKKILALLLVVTMIGLLFAGCNQQLLDITYSFEYGYVELPNGEVIEGSVSSWKDYEDSDSVQVVINGKTYYTHIENVVLISDQREGRNPLFLPLPGRWSGSEFVKITNFSIFSFQFFVQFDNLHFPVKYDRILLSRGTAHRENSFTKGKLTETQSTGQKTETLDFGMQRIGCIKVEK